MSKLGRWIWSACTVGLVVLAACDDGSGGTPSQITVSALSASVGRPNWNVRVGIPTSISLQTLPDGTCTLRSRAAGASSVDPPVFLDADASGIVRLQVQSSSDDPRDVSEMEADCADQNGNSKSFPFDVAGVSDPALETIRNVAVDSVVSGTIRPALAGDPMVPSQQELVAHGFPPRPDRTRNPLGFERWLRIVSRATTLVPPALHPHPRSNAQFSETWSGGELNNSGTVYEAIIGDWTVPTVSFTCNGGVCFDVMWIGLDGDGVTGGSSGNVVQDGTGTQMYLAGKNSFEIYFAWIEFYPLNEMGIGGFPVRPGDFISAEVWVGDVNGNPNPSGGYGWFFISNSRANASYEGKISQPGGVTYRGNCAEWIIERFNSNGTHWGLGNYGTASMVNVFARDSSGAQRDFSTDSSYDIQMWDHYNHNVILSSSSNTTNSVSFVWHAYGAPF